MVNVKTLSPENHYNALAGIINGMNKNPKLATQIFGHMVEIGFNAGAKAGIENGGEKDLFEMIAEQARTNDHLLYPHQIAIATILLRTGRVAGYENPTEFEEVIKNLNEKSTSLKGLAGHLSERVRRQNESDATKEILRDPDLPATNIENTRATSLCGSIFSCLNSSK